MSGDYLQDRACIRSGESSHAATPSSQILSSTRENSQFSGCRGRTLNQTRTTRVRTNSHRNRSDVIFASNEKTII